MKIVFFHKSCNDGLFSAYSAWKHFGEHNVEYIPIGHNDIKSSLSETIDNILYYSSNKDYNNFTTNKCKLLNDSNNYSKIDVYVLDFSFPINIIKEMSSIFKSINIYDHHVSFIDNIKNNFKDIIVDKGNIKEVSLFGNVNIVYSENMSGAKLSYMLFNNSTEFPDYIEYVSDRDLWIKSSENTDYFYYGSIFIGFESFEEIDKKINNTEAIIEQGKLYKKLINKNIKNIYVNANTINIIHNNIIYNGVIVNSAVGMQSDLSDYIIKKDNVDIVITYGISKNKVYCSVRSASNIDSLFLSTKYGGGGHKCASGFSISLDTLFNILKSKYINV